MKRRGRTPGAGTLSTEGNNAYLAVEGDPQSNHRSLGLAVRAGTIGYTTKRAREIGLPGYRMARG